MAPETPAPQELIDKVSELLNKDISIPITADYETAPITVRDYLKGKLEADLAEVLGQFNLEINRGGIDADSKIEGIHNLESGKLKELAGEALNLSYTAEGIVYGEVGPAEANIAIGQFLEIAERSRSILDNVISAAQRILHSDEVFEYELHILPRNDSSIPFEDHKKAKKAVDDRKAGIAKLSEQTRNRINAFAEAVREAFPDIELGGRER